MRAATRFITRLWAPAGVRGLAWMATAPLSVAYAGILAGRSAWWERFAQFPPLPTVSVGNLAIGGSGKTPFTLFLATRLQRSGVSVGIVSRGYGGEASRQARLVSDGRYMGMTARQAGDEPVMLAKSFHGPVAVARRRMDAIKLLAANALADAVVLDDGFQHVRLRRDFDLVLINQSRGLGNGWLLPAGPMREPLSAVQRADAVVLIETFGANRAIDSASEIMCGLRILRARLKPSALTFSENGKWRVAPLELNRKRVVAVSGVADSAGFHSMIRALGANLLGTLDYPDHYAYMSNDWKNILAATRQCEMLITTEKDLVKLEGFRTPELPFCALHLDVTMEAEEERQLLTLIMERIRHRPGARSVQGGIHRWH